MDCVLLGEHGLLRKVGPGTYLITDEGEAYLHGNYDADEGVYIEESADSSGPNSAESEPNGTT